MVTTLEEIVDASKIDRKISQLAKVFHEKPYENIIPALAEIDGSSKVFEEFGINPNQAMELAPAQVNAILESAQNRYKSNVIKGVQENYSEVLNNVADSDKGLQRIVGLFSGIKPVKFEGVDDKLYLAHEKLYNAAEASKSPRETFGKLMEKCKESVAGMAVMFLVQRNPGLIEYIVNYQKERAGVNLHEQIQNGLSGAEYMQSLYTASDDKAKVNIAYNLGTAFAQSELEKEAKNKSDSGIGRKAEESREDGAGELNEAA